MHSLLQSPLSTYNMYQCLAFSSYPTHFQLITCHNARKRSERRQEQSKNNRFLNHLFTPSYLSYIVAWHPPSSLCSLRPPSDHPSKITSIYPVHTLNLLPPSIPILLIQYSSILSMYPKHLYTHWSTLLAMSFILLLVCAPLRYY